MHLLESRILPRVISGRYVGRTLLNRAAYASEKIARAGANQSDRATAIVTMTAGSDILAFLLPDFAKIVSHSIHPPKYPRVRQSND